MKYISVFKSARDVIRLEMECKKNEIECKIIPVPEKYSSSCGMSLEFEEHWHDNIIQIIKKIKIEVLIYEK